MKANRTTPAQVDQAITDLMKTGMTGPSMMTILDALREARKKAEKRLR